jgi:hypothetical protein
VKRDLITVARALTIALTGALILLSAGCFGRDKRLIGDWELVGEGKIEMLHLGADGNARAVAMVYEQAAPAIIKLRWKARKEMLALWMEGTDFRMDFRYQFEGEDELTLRRPGEPDSHYKRTR